MAAFPDIKSGIPSLEPLNEGIQFKTLKSTTDMVGQEYRKSKWFYPKRPFNLKYDAISSADAKTIWQFFIDRRGSFEPFAFFHPYSRVYVTEYVGSGNGVQTIWNLPAKTSSSYTLYVDGTAQTAGGTDWTFGDGTGSDGEDKATMVAAPADGSILTFSFTGYLKIRCKFMHDQLDFETLRELLVGMGVPLQGLLNSEYEVV